MKLGVIRRILREDLEKAGSVPAWVDQLLYPLNQFISLATQALTNNLTFSDNFSGQQQTLTFTHGVEQKVNPTTSAKVIGVIPLGVASLGTTSKGTAPALISKWGWVYKADGTIGITFYFDAGSSGITVSSSTKLSVTVQLITG